MSEDQDPISAIDALIDHHPLQLPEHSAALMPHHADHERSLIADLLASENNPTLIHRIRERIYTPLAFYQRTLQAIYLVMLDIDDGAGSESRISFGVVVDRLQNITFDDLTDRLNRLKRQFEGGRGRRAPRGSTTHAGQSALEAVGGYTGLKELSTYAIGLDPAERVERIWDAFLCRQLLRSMQKVMVDCERTTQPAERILDAAMQSILSVTELERQNLVHGIRGTVTEVMEEIERIRTQGAEATRGDVVSTGFPRLDEILIGLRPGGLYVIAARPGVGKTSFALDMTHRIIAPSAEAVTKPTGVLFVTLEVDAVDIAQKMVTREFAGITFQAIENGDLEDYDIEALAGELENFKKLPLRCIDSSDLSVQALRGLVQREMTDWDELGLVVVDYLQLLRCEGVDESNENERVSTISRQLKNLARDLRIPVVALSQLSRENDKAEAGPRRPGLADLRGSGSIEQDCDAVLFLHRPNVKDQQDPTAVRTMELLVRKNRFGGDGDLGGYMSPRNQTFDFKDHL